MSLIGFLRKEIKVKYRLVVERHAFDLEKHVQHYIDRGWVPLGGVSACVIYDANGSQSWCLQQAMTHNGEGEKND